MPEQHTACRPTAAHAEPQRILSCRACQACQGSACLAVRVVVCAVPEDFSSMNGPMTSASRGEVQKHSIASRGLQTIGSLRVLNEVLTSTGTPVICWNAFRRS